MHRVAGGRVDGLRLMRPLCGAHGVRSWNSVGEWERLGAGGCLGRVTGIGEPAFPPRNSFQVFLNKE